LQARSRGKNLFDPCRPQRTSGGPERILRVSSTKGQGAFGSLSGFCVWFG
jgi:hypothetical protein